MIFIAGNLPMISEIAPLLIVIKLEQYDYAGAAAIGVVMLAASFVRSCWRSMLLQSWMRRRADEQTKHWRNPTEDTAHRPRGVVA